MSSINNLVPLEFNPVLEGGEITDYWWVGLILIIVIIIAIASMSGSDSSSENVQSTSVKQSSNMQMGVRTNENGEKEYYKIVDGEEQPLSEEDIKNLEAAQKASENVDKDVNKAISGLDIDNIVAESTANATAGINTSTSEAN